jgi:hypothetical protein
MSETSQEYSRLADQKLHLCSWFGWCWCNDLQGLLGPDYEVSTDCLMEEHAQTTEFSVWHLNGQYLQNYPLNLSGFDMCIWWLSITGCRWIRSSFSENNQRTPLQRVECGRKDRFPNHGNYKLVKVFTCATSNVLERNLCREWPTLIIIPMQSVRITCRGSISVCLFPASSIWQTL